MTTIENKIFDDIAIGDTAEISRTLTMNVIQAFALVSGDFNPAHVDEDYAKEDIFHHIIGHGMWTGALISSVLGMELPGPGTIYLSQTLQFLKPVSLGDVITAKVTVTEKIEAKHVIILDCVCTNQKGEAVVKGVAAVKAPTEKVQREKVPVRGVKFLM